MNYPTEPPKYGNFHFFGQLYDTSPQFFSFKKKSKITLSMNVYMIIHNLMKKGYLLEYRTYLNYDVPKMERWRVTVYSGKIRSVPKLERWRL